MHIIYKLENNVNNKVYIGQTSDFVVRMRQHRWAHGNQLINRAVRKYGWNNFEHQILLSDLSRLEANDCEIMAIQIYDCLSPKGYNVHRGGTHAPPTFVDITRIANRIKRIVEDKNIVSDKFFYGLVNDLIRKGYTQKEVSHIISVCSKSLDWINKENQLSQKQKVIRRLRKSGVAEAVIKDIFKV